jgi:hypothetical protein
MMMIWKGFGRKLPWPNLNLLSRNSPAWTKENNENLSLDSRSPGPRFKPGTSRIRSKSVNHSTITFGAPDGEDGL